jgi:hydrogenase maturation protein HypF
MSVGLPSVERSRLAVRVCGVVQGVGFRPFVYSEAKARGLSGWVRNGRAAVELEVEGLPDAMSAFVAALQTATPAAARVDRVVVAPIVLCGEGDEEGFQILRSQAPAEAPGSTMLPAPDQATCSACRAEVVQAGTRRFAYPFTACASCGPRYSMIEALPYDRERTTLGRFAMCNRCAAEYGDPADRRFHAEAIACPGCGPALALLSGDGTVIERHARALAAAEGALRDGAIVALKGLGGYQLLVDATDASAVARLRERKRRDEKPFALLVATIDDARRSCFVSREEEALLASPAGPIVLLDRLPDAGDGVAASVAPGLRRLGVMLPSTPLHHLLALGLARPLVCTSGNRSDEPICADEPVALAQLAGIADLWLAHDRAIVRPVDDSVAQVGAGGPELLRRARGYVPVPLLAPGLRGSVLAFGGQQKSTLTLLADGRLIVGEHIGDLGAPRSVARLERSAIDLCALTGVAPAAIACDAHPDFASSRVAKRWAETQGLPLIPVQHHHAHAAACMVEHGLGGLVLALVWDGAGLGDDGTIWGGEALVVEGAEFRRHARLRTFLLPGGARAMRDPVLSLVGLAAEGFGVEAEAWLARIGLAEPPVSRALDVARRPALAHRTSSMGRLFDGVAALLGICRRPGYEAAAAMRLEAAADEQPGGRTEPYPFPIRERAAGAPAELDFAPLLQAIAADRVAGASVGRCAVRFHETLAVAALALAAHAGHGRIVLSGGCFQNRRLAGLVRARLETAGFSVYAPRQFPANDGGLSLGQAAVAAWRLERGS